MLAEATDILQALADENKLPAAEKSCIDLLKKSGAGLDEAGARPSGGWSRVGAVARAVRDAA